MEYTLKVNIKILVGSAFNYQILHAFIKYPLYVMYWPYVSYQIYYENTRFIECNRPSSYHISVYKRYRYD